MVRVEEILPDGERIIALTEDVDLYAHGSMPLPPYIGRDSDSADNERYQTVFAETPGRSQRRRLGFISRLKYYLKFHTRL